jgi:energy-converting hydrogenase A subunit R
MSLVSRKVFISDCEGPISKNDNAFELAAHFIPQGDRFFALLSRYDDILADIVKKPSYKAGDTLKLILPFLKAYGATNQTITEYSSKNVLLMPGAKTMLRFVRVMMPSFIVSTSYEQYIRALCNLVDFPFENVYCTRLNLDKYKLDKKERERLKQLRKEIHALPTPEIPKGARSLQDLSRRHREAIKKLDRIFWEEICQMDIGRIFDEVNPVGGREKAEAVRSIIRRLGNKLSDVMYVGDSITDVSAFRLVRKNGGLTVSFNGNEYAVREAEVAVLSENALVTAVLADAFNRLGRNGVLKLVEEWGYEALQKWNLNSSLQDSLLKLYPERLPKVEIVTSNNMEQLMEESSVFRKTVRGEAIGRLG